jgi:glyoxylase-like metal-dependent hydrolase (beta-lactamase superfamily II)
MNRRQFILSASALAAVPLVLRSTLLAQTGTASAASATKLPPTEFRALRRGTGLFTGRGGTIGWLSSPEALVVVDTQFPDTASLCLAGLPGRDARLIDAVINTHHHSDHTSGNPAFKPVSRALIAQRKAPKYQMRAAEKAGTLDRQVFADTLFDDVWRKDFGAEIVTAQHYGAAHTGGDCVVGFEKANVVHMGDLVFNRLYPVIDRPGGANIRNWILVLERIHKEFSADTLFIHGHGNPKFGVTGSRADLLVMRDYLSALLEYVSAQIAAGKPKQELAKLENLPGFPDFHVPAGRGNRLPSNLETAFDELTAKEGA